MPVVALNNLGKATFINLPHQVLGSFDKEHRKVHKNKCVVGQHIDRHSALETFGPLESLNDCTYNNNINEFIQAVFSKTKAPELQVIWI